VVAVTREMSRSRPLRVSVLRDRYPTAFNSPRNSRHDVRSRLFVPFNFLKSQFDGFTLMSPFNGADLVHVVNRIPFGSRRMICSFESHIPRHFGMADNSLLTKLMMREIASNRCRRLVGMSHFAKRTTLAMHEGTPAYDLIKSKLMVLHPNVELGRQGDRLEGDDASSLILTFVGGHFIRKGGCVSVRIAEKAIEQGLPIHVNIVSSLQAGASVWSDPTDPDFLETYTKLLALPNVTHYPGLPNEAARDLVGKSHFALLPTFEDTFGFTAIEALAEYTPVIGTGVCALPEVILPGRNGHLLHLEQTELGEWVRPDKTERHTDAYTTYYRDTVEYLADQAIEYLKTVIGKPSVIRGLRRDARFTAKSMFSAEVMGKRWDDLYERVAAEPTNTLPVCDPVLDRSSPESPAFLFYGKSARC
jgi:glycosyltransferase involved in cell wall biosynthesis